MLALLAAGCAGGADGAASDSDGLVLVRIVDGSNEVVRARISDGAIRGVTATPDREESWPYWSGPTGRLVVQVADPAAPGGEVGPASLVFLDPDTGREVAVEGTHQRDARWAAWSQDGQSLAYAFRGGRPLSGIALFRLNAAGARVIAAAGRRDLFLRPHFAPDGTRLVAQRRGPDGTGSTLWIVAAGRPPVALTSDPARFDLKADFTRGGDRVVFSRRPAAGGPRDVLVQALDGSAPRIVASDPGADDHSAQASPVADEIAFVSDRAGSYDVYLAGLDGGGLRALSSTSDRHEFAPRWSPDGARLAVTTTAAADGPPRLADRESLARARVVVLDRDGRVLLDMPGFMADWMRPWR